MQKFAAILLFAAFAAANVDEMDITKGATKFGDAYYETLTGTMVSYELNGYDWPLTCQTGRNQSPIDLNSGFASKNTKLAIRAKGFEDITTGTMRKSFSKMALDLSTSKGQYDIIDPQGLYTEYYPVEAVIRSPSEHTVDGITYDMELQLQFKKLGGGSKMERAGISIFFDGAVGGRMESDFVASLGIKRPLTHRPQPDRKDGIVNYDYYSKNESFEDLKAGSSWAVSNVALPKLLSSMADSTYWSYEGSMTTPPCTEGVNWTVFEKVLNIQYEQAQEIRNHFNKNANWQGSPNGNNRGTQPLNRRYIYYGGASALVAGATALAAVYLF